MPKNAIKALKPYVIMRDEKKKAIEVNLYGEVVQNVPRNWWTGEKIDGLFIELAQFLDDLDSFKDAEAVTFRINSIGGDVDAGISIYNRIRELSAHTTTIVDGIAASAASIIAQAGDERKVNLGAQTMIHGASVGLIGYYNVGDLQRMTGMLDAINTSVAGIYADRSGQSVSVIKNMMKKETWMTPEEAVTQGFADEVIGNSEPVVDKIEGSSVYLVNGIPHNLRNFNLPDHMIHAVLPHETLNAGMMRDGNMRPVSKPKVVNGLEPSAIENLKEGEEAMDLKELMQKYPELVEQIRNEAVETAQTENDKTVENALAAERNRIKDIDSIAQMVGDPAMVEKAKYEEPITASELAFKAMQAQQAAGRSYLTDREAELAGNEVSTPVNSGIEDTVAEDEAELNAIINKIKEGK